MMGAWRLAGSLDALRAEILAEWPGTVIGTIGDEAHQDRASDHNPNDFGVVCAIDVMVGGTIDVAELVRLILVKPHRDLTYVIFRGKLYHRRNNFRPVAFTGSDPHDNHAHISVGIGTDGDRQPPYDDRDSWGVDVSLTPDQADILNTINGRLYAITQGQAEVTWGKARGEKVAVVQQLNDISARLAELERAAGQPVDLDALVDKLVDKLAARLVE